MFVSGATITHQAQESHLYQDLGPAGGGSLTRSGVVIRALLMDAGLDPDHVSLLVVAHPRGGSGYLYHADLAQLSDFPDGPALVSVDGKSTRFFRPQRTPDDQNAADDIATADGQPLAVSVYTGKLLKLTASHAPAHALRGQPVHSQPAASCCSLPGETLTLRSAPSGSTIIVREGQHIRTIQLKGQRVVGRGTRVGSVFRLADGRIIYVPGR